MHVKASLVHQYSFFFFLFDGPSISICFMVVGSRLVKVLSFSTLLLSTMKVNTEPWPLLIRKLYVGPYNIWNYLLLSWVVFLFLNIKLLKTFV